MLRRITLLVVLATWLPKGAASQDSVVRRLPGDSVVIRFVDADIRAILRGLAPFLAKPILTSELQPSRVTLESPRPIAREQLLALVRGMVEARGLTWQEDSAFYRVTAAPPAQAAQQSSAGGEAAQLVVVSLKHARAVDVAATVNQLFGSGGGGLSARRGLSTGTLAEELRRTTVPDANAPRPSTPEGQLAVNATLRGPVSLVPDERTNSLLVRGNEQDIALIRQAIQQLDIRPLQVLIEVLVVEVRKNRSFDLALSAEAHKKNGATKLGAEISSTNPGNVVLSFMRMSRLEVDGQLSAAVARGDASLVSRPVLLASNNSEARFLVGTQRPFVQVSRTLPTESPVRDQVVQYRDVGNKLTVRPSINQDGYVALFLQQEISAATDETQFGAPVISTREASTELLVRDGQTIVIGGLADSTKTRASGGLPVLSAIPFIGGLFGSSRRRSEATEVYLFLTPRVIRSDADVDSLTKQRLRQPTPPDTAKRP